MPTKFPVLSSHGLFSGCTHTELLACQGHWQKELRLIAPLCRLSCVPLKFVRGSPDCTGDRAFEEVMETESWCDRNAALLRGGRDSRALSHVGHREGPRSAVQEESSPGPSRAGAMTSDFQPPELWESGSVVSAAPGMTFAKAAGAA